MTLTELFSVRERWTLGATARNIVGERVSVNSTEAVCWCLSGAIEYLYPECKTNFEVRDKLMKVLEGKGFRGILTNYNDFQGYEAVVELVTEAGV